MLALDRYLSNSRVIHSQDVPILVEEHVQDEP